MTLDQSRFVLDAVTEPVLQGAPGPDAPPSARSRRGEVPGGGYGDGAYGAGRTRWPAMVAVVALHISLVIVVLTAHMSMNRPAPNERLTVFDVASDPALPEVPPEPQQLATPEMPRPQTFTAPQPLVDVPIILRAEITPSPPTIQASVPSIEAPTAPPAPITPPDFTASQLANPGPDYPYQSRRYREEGVVMLRVLVTEGGQAGEIRIERSSGFERLDRAAMGTVRRWRFLPARQAGNAIAAWVLVPITFALN